VVLFEAPHRLEATLVDLAAALGPDRPVAVAREITKKFETVWRGTLGEASGSHPPEARGEQVVVLGPPPPAAREEPGDEVLAEALREELAGGASTRDAAAAVAARLGVARRRAYNLATSLGEATRS
jgi:16S rRNA (cytidine1402-2'-O)-methyltransferase